MFRLVVISTICWYCCSALLAQATNNLAPGAPGLDAHWPSAAKNGFGTATTNASKVWFTLNDGVMTEVYYPRLDVPNVQKLELIIVGDKVETESDDTNHGLEIVDSRALSYRQINTAKSGNYAITKTYTTDPQHNTVLIDVQFSTRTANDVYVYYDPSLNNSGMHDSAWSSGDALLAGDSDIASALLSSSGFATSAAFSSRDQKPRLSYDRVISSGYFGTSDGLTELKESRLHAGFTAYRRAGNGNVVQVAALQRLENSDGNAVRRFTLALSFGKTPREALRAARASLAKGFPRARDEYQAGWHAYLKSIRHVETGYQQQFNIAAMVLKALEDKTYRGAMIASPSTPWGGGPNANEPAISGYHAVWARDLYHVATAFLAIGDRASANRALDYLFRVQQKADGSFPQNSWVDGRPIGSGLQMDQVALPLVLAYQLQRIDAHTWRKHVKPAADFIVRKGPATGQDRWEEKPGYSPATIAAEIAGLVCAAKIAMINGAEESAKAYLQTADEWANHVERWTATKGTHGDGHYYLRITENNDPDDGAHYEVNSSSLLVDERAILDAGFLELVRLGIKSPNDPLVRESLALVDQLIKVDTRNGAAWYRYNHDAYGERADGGDYDGRTGVGRLWTLLTGERGEYDIARGDLTGARKRLDAMMLFANEGMMIPEQVWDRAEIPRASLDPGEGTGSATPLAWSMAQFLRLAVNLSQAKNIETPAVTKARYLESPAKK